MIYVIRDVMSGHNLVYVLTREEALEICKCSLFTYEPLDLHAT